MWSSINRVLKYALGLYRLYTGYIRGPLSSMAHTKRPCNYAEGLGFRSKDERRGWGLLRYKGANYIR